MTRIPSRESDPRVPRREMRRIEAEGEGRAVDDPGDDFDQVARLTRRVVRGAAVGVPTWVVLLAALPFTGLGVGACLALATLLSIAAVVLADRLWARGAPAEGGAPRERRSLSPLAAAALTLAAVGLVVYVVFVIRAA